MISARFSSLFKASSLLIDNEFRASSALLVPSLQGVHLPQDSFTEYSTDLSAMSNIEV